MDKIIIKGAKENNLKNIDIELPKNKLIVMTGVSGSGKSSLAFDTIYAEGQRRYVESLSNYARQFLGGTEKPNVDSIEGLSPAISIDQKTTNKNPRSTVGTVTEIYDFLRLLYARIGVPYCPVHNKPISSQSYEEMVDQVLNLEENTKIKILSPVVFGEKGSQATLIEKLKKDGYVRLKIDGEEFDIEEVKELDKNKKHNIEVVIDRIIIKDGIRSRLYDSIETAAKLSKGKVVVDVVSKDSIVMSENYACPECDFSLPELEPRMFSFNAPYGACSECKGLGIKLSIDEDLIIPNKDFYIKDFKILTKNEIMDTYKEISSNNSFSNINSRVERCILLLSKQIELRYDSLIIKLTEFINKLSDETSDKNEISKLAKIREEIKKELMNGCRQSLKKYFTNNNLSVINLYKNFITNYDSYSDNSDITIKLKEYTLNIMKQNLIDAEDLPALMYIKYKICGSMQYSNIKQIVVDEAQDYGDFNFYILKCIFNNSYFSIYGDLAQSIYSYKSINSWNSVQNIIFENNADILTLKKSYRTTVEIMEEANNITKMLNLNTATPVIRHGKQVNYIKSNDKINSIINEINKALENNYKSIAIISKTTNESNSIYQELFNRKINITNIDNSNTQYLGGICTIPSHLSKGLEFDVVIISDANESIFNSSNQTDMKLLYVSMTRPLHELTIIYSDNLNKALKNND